VSPLCRLLPFLPPLALSGPRVLQRAHLVLIIAGGTAAALPSVFIPGAMGRPAGRAFLVTQVCYALAPVFSASRLAGKFPAERSPTDPSVNEDCAGARSWRTIGAERGP